MSIKFLSGVNVDSNTLVVDAANDRVGIGTATPSVELAIYQSSTPRLHLQNSTSGTTSTDGLQIALSGVDGYLWNWENGPTIFGTNSAERMRITAAGNVGIGVASPNEKLQVGGNINAYISGGIDAGLFASTSAGSTTIALRSNGITHFNGGNVGIGTTSPVSLLNLNNGDAFINVTDTLRGLQFGYAGPSHGSYRAAVMGGAEAYGGTDSGMLTFHTQNGYVVSAIPPERMRITSTGNVLIGTTTDSGYKLGINGSLSTTYANVYDPTSWSVVNIAASSASVSASTHYSPYGTISGTNPVFCTGQKFSEHGNYSIWRYNGSSHLATDFAINNSGAATFSSSVTASSLIKSGGTSAQYLMADGSVSTLTNPVTGTGTTNYIPKFTSASAIGNSQIFDNGTSVGIGTASPTAKLQVDGDIITGNASILKSVSGFLLVQGATNLVLDGATGTVNIRTNSTDKLVVTNSGNVGIGTTSPVVKLQVDGTITSTGVLTAYTSVPSINIGHNGDSAFIAATSGGGANTPISFSVGNNNEKMRITAAGNVGIGTTSPGGVLDVQTNNTSEQLVRFWNTNTSGTGSSAVRIANSGNNNDGSRIEFSDSQYYVATISGDRTQGIVFRTSATGSSPTGISERMRITAAGNVGIGTTSPANTLDIAAAQATLRLQSTTGTNTVFAKLENTAGTFYIARDNSAGSSFGVANAAFLYETGANPIVFFTNSAERMRLHASGNLSIGNTNDTYKLDVTGTGRFSDSLLVTTSAAGSLTAKIRNTVTAASGSTGYGLAIESEASAATSYALTVRNLAESTTYFHISTATGSVGNVGIGTTSPVTKLQVVGGSISIDADQPIRKAGDNSIIGYSSTLPGINIGSGTATDMVVFNAGGAERVRINTSGNVGIGTTTPTSILDASLSGGATSGFRFKGYSDAGTPYLLSLGTETYPDVFQVKSVNGLVTMGVVGATGAAPDLVLQTNTTERMRITSAGNVGIGTTSPAARLQVAGSAAVNTREVIADFRNSSDSQRIDIRDENAATTQPPGLYSATAGYGLGLYAGGAGAPIILYAGGITNSEERMRILGTNGNVGIGTTAPNRTLTVNGVLGVASGTTNVPELALSADGSGTYISSTYKGTSSYQPLVFETNGSEKVRITTGGNVGIGTTSPNAQLDAFTTQGGSTIAATHGTGGTYPKASGISFGATSTSLSVSNNGGTVVFTGGAGIYANNTASSNNPTELVFWTTSGGTPAARLTIASTGAATFSSSVEATSFIKTSGTASQYLMADGSVSTLTNPVTGTGTTNYVPKWTSASAIGNSQIFDNGTNVGIGTTAPFLGLSLYKQSDTTFTNIPANVLLHDSTAMAGGVGGGIWFGGRYITDSNEATTFAGISGIKENSTSTNPAGVLTFGVRAADGGVNIERMRITSAGNVGIGTTAPANTLQIGSVGATGYSGNKLAIGDGTNVVVLHTAAVSYLTANGDIVVGAGGNTTNQLYVKSGGNVGIGTASPASLLHIYGSNPRNFIQDSGTGYPYVQLNNSSGDFYLSIDSSSGSGFGSAYGRYLYSNGAYPIILVTNSAERLRITSAGNVGIGTPAPQGQLSLNSQITNSGTPLTYSTVQQNVLNGYYTTGESPNLYMRYFDIACVGDGDGTNGGGNIRFLTNPVANDTAVERMRINYDGNVGIGTTSPATKLQVSGTFASNSLWTDSGGLSYWGNYSTAYGGLTWDTGYATVFATAGNSLRFGSNGASPDMVIDTSGNVGIGTTSPSYKLTVLTTGTLGFSLNTYNSTVGGPQIDLYDSTRSQETVISSTDGTTVGTYLASFTNHPLLFGTYAASTPTARMAILPSGNVGIGTTSPDEKLHVEGSTLITYNNSFQSTNSVGNKAILARVSPTSGIINYAEYATATNLNGFVIGSDDARVKGNITGDSLEFITNTSTRMTILSGGNVGINTTTPGSTLHVIGDVLIQTGALGVGVNPSATDGRIDASNDIVAFSTSDKRLKENITPIANALEKVRSLTGVEFDWKEETKSVHGYEGHDVGVIAQDVQAVLPEAVRTNDTGYLSVRYEKMIALLIEANKELANRVEQLEKLIK